MHLRVGLASLGQPKLKPEGEVSPRVSCRGPVTFSAANIWPVPEVIITLFFSSGLVSTSVKVLCAALAKDGCCIPFACWLPILILLYLLVFYLLTARTLSKFVRQHAQLVFVPFSPEHMDDVLDPFLRLYNQLRTRCCRSTRQSPFVHQYAGLFLVGTEGHAEPERTRRISLNPFRFAALASSSTTTQDRIGGVTGQSSRVSLPSPKATSPPLTGHRSRVSPSPRAPLPPITGQKSRVSPSPRKPTPPPSPTSRTRLGPQEPVAGAPVAGASAPAAVQQAMDAAYSLYFVWLGDARRGRERFALIATLHTLLIVLVGSTSPLCTGNYVDGPLVAILLLQLSAVAWYLLARPTADRVLGSIMVYVWIIEASASACYLATPSQLSSGALPRSSTTRDLAFGLQLGSLFTVYVMCVYISLRALVALFCCKRPLRSRPTKERALEPDQEHPSAPGRASAITPQVQRFDP